MLLTVKTSLPIVRPMRTKKPQHVKKSYVVALRIEQDIGQKLEDLANTDSVPVGQILRWAVLRYIDWREIHSREEVTPCPQKTNSSNESQN